MTVEATMTSSPLSLGPSDKVCDALLIMYEHRVHNLPVVDPDGCFVGLFGIRRLIQILLPKAAQLDRYSLSDLSYLPDDPIELAERLGEVSRHPVSDFLEKKKNLRFCTPDTPFPELLHLLNKSDTSLPVIVVTGEKKKLVGMVSEWDILTKIIAVKLFPKTKR